MGGTLYLSKPNGKVMSDVQATIETLQAEHEATKKELQALRELVEKCCAAHLGTTAAISAGGNTRLYSTREEPLARAPHPFTMPNWGLAALGLFGIVVFSMLAAVATSVY